MTQPKMILSIEEARETVRVDGSDNDVILIPLVEAIPNFLEIQTGRSWIEDTDIYPLAKTAAKFVLQLWYYPQSKEAARIQRTIDSLIKLLAVEARARS